ncbi:hypothetical protein LguiA_005953 [Lonicera macranthoides]
MKRSISEKMLSQKQKNTNNEKRIAKKSRFLITVNVLGSTGPLRFLVKESDSVSCVIDAALKFYASEGRLPTLCSDLNSFLLYPANSGWDSLNLGDPIGESGVRKFVLCKKQRQPQMTEAQSDMIARKGRNNWKAWAWLNKSFSLKLLSSH